MVALPDFLFGLHRGEVASRQAGAPKAVYLALSINLAGNKELLVLWPAELQSAKFWLLVMTTRICSSTVVTDN